MEALTQFICLTLAQSHCNGIQKLITPHIFPSPMRLAQSSSAINFFDKLPADLQQLLKTSGIMASNTIREETRRENTASKQLLIDNGVEFLWDWDEINLDEFIDIRDNAAKHLIKTNYFPEDFFNTTRSHLSDYRKQKL